MRSIGPLYLAFLLGSCGTPSAGVDEGAIRTVMERQETAWDNGDIPGFMDGYADSVCFIGAQR
jgi:hypothetical protein